MCLKRINSDRATAVRQSMGGVDGYIVAYKTLLPVSSTIFKSANHAHTWKLGEVSKSTRKTVQVSPTEQEAGKLNKGFHFYKDYDKARKNCPSRKVVGMFMIKTSDLVAFGANGWDGSSGLVSTTAKLVEIVLR